MSTPFTIVHITLQVSLNRWRCTAAAASLAQGISRLASDPGVRARLGAANRRCVEESFTFGKMCAAYREIYESALASVPVPR